LKIWYIRDVPGYERIQYRYCTLAEVFSDHDFRVLYPEDFASLAGERADVTFISGRQAASAVWDAGLLDRTGLRIYIPSWRRGGCKEEIHVARNIKPCVICPSQEMYLSEWRKEFDRVHFVDRGFDPQVFCTGSERDKTEYIVFCGNPALGRLERLELLAGEFPGKVSWKYELCHAEMADYLRSGRIGWNQILRGPPHHTTGINYRVWEVLGCGVMMLCSFSAHIPLIDGVHCVFWYDDKDMIEKARYYLEHDDERQRIAEAGHKEAIEKHTWMHRALQYRGIVERYV